MNKQFHMKTEIRIFCFIKPYIAEAFTPSDRKPTFKTEGEAWNYIYSSGLLNQHPGYSACVVFLGD